MSGIGVGLSSSFLRASEGDVRQFFGGWFLDRLGLNPAGVWLRSCHCSSIHSSIHYMVFARFFHAFEAACLVMSGIGVGLSSSFLWASEGDVRQFFGGWFLDRLGLNPAGAPNGGRSCHRSCHCSSIHSSIHYMVFAWFFHAFEAACLVMSGIGVGLLHLSCGRQKATLGSFSGAGFWTGWA